ncbi:MAG: hypothetical protein LBM75_00410 [Myxococcales bacterium]|nr:hypothetical protein [Myxococcales bacterium]
MARLLMALRGRRGAGMERFGGLVSTFELSSGDSEAGGVGGLSQPIACCTRTSIHGSRILLFPLSAASWATFL